MSYFILYEFNVYTDNPSKFTAHTRIKFDFCLTVHHQLGKVI